MLTRLRSEIVRFSAIALSLFTLWEVNYPLLTPQSQLAIFAGLGLILCFLVFPVHSRWKDSRAARVADVAFSAASLLCCGYVVVHNEPYFQPYWIDGRALSARAGLEGPADIAMGVVGLIIVLEATRRAIGWALPILSTIFLLYAYAGPSMPDWLFPHRGYPIERIVSQTFLQGQGVFGVALKVMFTYVFLFVLFGVLLEATGATGFILGLARRMFRRSAGGPAKVAVLSSGLMGSLSGSAVANTATTGTFTIPMMRSSGFQARIAAGVEAAASSGGALVPPIMGAGAYMMLEIVTPPVTYLEIIRAALLPAILYYLSLLLIVHFFARRLGASGEAEIEVKEGTPLEGTIFFASLTALIAFLVVGYTPFRAVTLAMAVVIGLGALSRKTRIGPKALLQSFVKTARNGVALVAAASCVGIIIGVVTLTGVGTRFPSMVLPLAEQNLFLALVLIMLSSIILGMGLPSAVCYLLLATLIGPMLGNLGVVPLAAHFFIFYFGMMSMVTPPVALAAYTSASIAGSPIMPTAFAAFRFALVGFSLPYIFVARPALMMMQPDGSPASPTAVLLAFAAALLGIVPLAAGIAGFLFSPLNALQRALMIAAAVLTLFPGGRAFLSPTDWAGLALFIATAAWAGYAARIKA